jgi:MoxR-like ATPase
LSPPGRTAELAVLSTTGTPRSNQACIHDHRQALTRVIVGQTVVLDRLVIGLLADGRVLVEGPPGLAKTTAVKTLAAAVHGSLRRIQFTPICCQAT